MISEESHLNGRPKRALEDRDFESAVQYCNIAIEVQIR